MAHRSRTMAVSAATAVALALSGCTPLQPWRSVLVSVDADGNGFNGTPTPAVISPDGTQVVFESDESDLGPTDTNGLSDLYLRDVVTGTTRLVSTNAAGTDSGNGATRGAVFSPDGTKLAFTSRATDLGPPDSDASLDPGAEVDAYVLDLATGTIAMASANAAGTDSGNAPSSAQMFTPDSSQLVFQSQANDLGPVDTNARSDSYLYDLATGEVTLAVPNEAGTDAWPTGSSVRDFSADGTSMLFDSGAQVYVQETSTGATTLASVNAAGTGGGNGSSWSTDLSDDGTKVAFTSFASDLGPTDTNGSAGSVYDVYVRDLAAGTTSLVSVNAAGTDAGNLGAYDPFASFSPDGNLVAFSSASSDLVPDDTNTCTEPPSTRVQPCPDAFVHDLTTGATTLVSADAGGNGPGNGFSRTPVFSPDGTRVLFVSQASNLGPVDTNGAEDVYVRDLVTGTVTLVSANAEGTDSANSGSFAPSFGPDGTTVAFGSFASDLDPEGRGGFDIYLATLQGADLGIQAGATNGGGDGGAVTYEIVVANDGPEAAVGVTTAIVHPGPATFVGAGGDGDCTPLEAADPHVVLCNLGDLPVGATAEQTITIETPHPLPTLVATDAETPDPDRADNHTVVDPGTP
jgi:Tol biopolymer transport system component